MTQDGIIKNGFAARQPVTLPIEYNEMVVGSAVLRKVIKNGNPVFCAILDISDPKVISLISKKKQE